MNAEKIMNLLVSCSRFLLVHQMFHFDDLDLDVKILPMQFFNEITLIMDNQVVVT